ncbi:hypothetical protein K1719_002024 [Acacia pycnantha]|nr:hypothetical protein K1719_002024 [Acacia pycnantha]
MDCLFYWNSRGACGRGLFRNLKLLCKKSQPSVIVLADSRIRDVARFKCLGFDSLQVIPSLGQSGGLAVGWNSSRISVSVLEEDRQFFHLQCQLPQSYPFFITVVYSLPYVRDNSVLWDSLLRLSRTIASPWSVIGDFNEILSGNERIGGRGGSASRM